MRKLISLFILCLFIACSENDLPNLDFMAGTWKVEGKEQYEVWESTQNNGLSGYSYRNEDGQKIITETLSIKFVDNRIIYEATVPDQNDGKTIPFTLNQEIKDYLSFENPDHDFPKKIQYKRTSDDELDVTVLGSEDQGFSFKLVKPKNQ